MGWSRRRCATSLEEKFSVVALAACTWMIRSVGFEEFETMMIGAGYIGAGGSLSQHKNSPLRLESLPDHYFFEALCNNFSKKVVAILFFFLLCSINCLMICKTMVARLIKNVPCCSVYGYELYEVFIWDFFRKTLLRKTWKGIPIQLEIYISMSNVKIMEIKLGK